MTSSNSNINHLRSKEARWFAIRTNFKHEKAVADFLREKNFKVCLPLLDVVKKYKSKTKNYKIPLISNYVFVNIVKSDYIPILETPGVLGFIKIANNLISIPDYEIEIVKKVVGGINNFEAVPIDSNKIIGKEVEIIEGSLVGLKGKVIKKANKNILIIELKGIGYNLKINVDKRIIQPITNKKQSILR